MVFIGAEVDRGMILLRQIYLKGSAKLCPMLLGFFLLPAHILSANQALAEKLSSRTTQGGRSGVSSLGQMRCKNITDSFNLMGGNVRYVPIKEAIPVEDNQFLTAIGFLGFNSPGFYGRGIWAGSATDVVCTLSSSFKTLTLAFAFDARTVKKEGNRPIIVKLSVYSNGNQDAAESEYVRLGDRLKWDIDVSRSRYVTLKVECVKNPGNQHSCPALYFFQDTLR